MKIHKHFCVTKISESYKLKFNFNTLLTQGAYSDIPEKNKGRFKTFDQNSNFCSKHHLTSNEDLCNSFNVDSKPKCCCDSSSCAYGSMRSIFQVMKESLYHPHFLDLDSRMKSFDGDVIKSFNSKPPFYMSEDILGFKLIGPDSFKDQTYSHRHFFTPEPFIPFCKINDDWANLPFYGAISIFSDEVKYCTFFRPKLTDYGICYAMNSFTKVITFIT